MEKTGCQQFFVEKNSVVRKIWGQSETVLFIFAGAAAEFALNKAVDWLYFTGKLPSDPLNRLLSTVRYARKIVFSSTDAANEAIDTITRIHSAVEQCRGAGIPDWAYRDVLFMLIHYSIASYELLETSLSKAEKEEVYNVFYRLGTRMGLKALPLNYDQWLSARAAHLKYDLQKSSYTADLFRQYRKHLGFVRFRVLIEAQKLLVPGCVRARLHFSRFSLLKPVVPLYKIARMAKTEHRIKALLLPSGYKDQLMELDAQPTI